MQISAHMFHNIQFIMLGLKKEEEKTKNYDLV